MSEQHKKESMKEQYNYRGEKLPPQQQFLPIDLKYFIDADHPDWGNCIQYGDEWGFDTRCSMDESGNYIVRVILPVGKKIVRYGLDTGKFTTDEGTAYEQLSMPYIKSSLPYHEYIVRGECEVDCYVEKGKVAPGFGSEGGAIQYRHYMNINESVRRGILEEDYQWLKTH